MKIKVYVFQEAAVRAGENRYGDMEVDVDVSKLTEDQRQMLIQKAVQDSYSKLLLVGGAATEEEVVRTLDIFLAKEAAEKAEYEAERKEWLDHYLAMSQDEFNRADLLWSGSRGEALGAPELAGRRQIRDAARKAEAEAKRKANAEAEAEAEAKRKAKAEAEAEAEAERKVKAQVRAQQISDWVAQYGSQNQQQRHAAGLLPEDEVSKAIESRIYAALEGYALYETLKASDVCECEDNVFDRYCKVSFDVYPAHAATAEEWEMMKEIRNAIPQAQIVLREHVGEGSDCDGKVVRRGIQVKVALGTFEFVREYVA